MKKASLFMIFCLAAAFTVEAQDKFEIRPLAGINFGSVSTTPDGTETSAKVGYQFGGHLLIGGRFHLYPGITYSQSVTEYVSTDTGEEDVTVDQTVAGIEIPILAGFRVIDPESEDIFNIRIFAGPSLTIHTKTEYSESFFDDEFEWNDTAWGARVGAGIDIAFLFVDVAYDIGLTDIHEVSEAADAFKDTKSNTFLVNAGIRIKI